MLAESCVQRLTTRSGRDRCYDFRESILTFSGDWGMGRWEWGVENRSFQLLPLVIAPACYLPHLFSDFLRP